MAPTHVIPGPSRNDNLPLKTQHFALRGRCRLEKSADQIEKDVELVMVDPMAGIFERNDPGVVAYSTEYAELLDTFLDCTRDPRS